jgi:hypothetical protein
MMRLGLATPKVEQAAYYDFSFSGSPQPPFGMNAFCMPSPDFRSLLGGSLLSESGMNFVGAEVDVASTTCGGSEEQDVATSGSEEATQATPQDVCQTQLLTPPGLVPASSPPLLTPPALPPPLLPLPPELPAAVSLPADKGSLSKGSMQHNTGMCRPCAWFWKPMGCESQENCEYCHLCPEGELKVRKKSKLVMMRMGLITPKSALSESETRYALSLDACL